MAEPVDVVRVGPLSLRVVQREVVLADRIIGFKHWRTTAYGAQAVALLSLFGESLNDDLLRSRVRAEGAEDALQALRELAARAARVDEGELQRALRRLHRSPEEERGDS